MGEEPAAPIDLDGVLDQLRARVAERRRSGVYPPGLEDALEDHFRRIVAHRTDHDSTDVRARIAALDERSRFDAGRIHVESQTPGGKVLHQAVAKAVGRQTQGALDQVQHYADGVRSVLVALAEALDDPAHVHADLVEQFDTVLERLASAERRAVVAEAALDDLARRVAQLEASPPADE